MSSLLLLLLLGLFMHASNARRLGVTGRDSSREVDLLSKVVDLQGIASPSKLRPSMETNEEVQQQIQYVGSEKRKHQENSGGVSTMKQIDSEGLFQEAAANKEATSGSEIRLSSSQEVLQQATKATKIAGWKRHARMMLGSAPHHAEETVDSKEGDIVEDVIVMDYAQPHRKPPIHNKDP